MPAAPSALAAFVAFAVVAVVLPAQDPAPLAKARDAVAAAEREHGADAVPTAVQRGALGKQLFRMGRLDEAVAESQAALAVLEKHLPEQDLPAADVLLVLGAAAGLRQDLQGAITNYRRALDLRERHDPPGAPYLQLLRFNLASTLQASSDHAGALALAEVGLRDEVAKPEPRPAMTGNLHAVAAMSLDGLGRYQAAFEQYEAAEKDLAKASGPQHPDVLRMDGLAGVVACRLGRSEEGLARIDRALQAMRAAASLPTGYLDELEVARGVMRLVHVGDEASFAELPALLRKAIADTRGGVPGAPGRVILLMAGLDLADPTAVDLDLARRCIEQLENGQHGERSMLAAAWSNLGRMYERRGDAEAAERCLDRAVVVLDEQPEHLTTDRWKVLWTRAELHRRRGRGEAAFAVAQRILSDLPKMLDAWSSPLDERQRLELASTARTTVDLALDLSGELQRPAADRWQIVLAWHGLVSRGLLQSLQFLQRHRDPAAGRLADVLRAATGRLAAAQRTGAAGDALATAQRERDDAARELAQRFATATPAAPAASAIAAAMAPDEVLVHYWVHTASRALPNGRYELEERLCAFVVERGGAPAVFDLGPLAEVAAAVDAFVRVASRWTRPTPGADELVAGAGQRLAALVLAPLRDRVPAGHRLVICPDSVVALVPFACLPGRAPGTFCLEDHEIVYVASPADLLDRRPRPPLGERTRLAAVGGVDYGHPSAPQEAAGARHDAPFADLPGTAAEAEAVAAAFVRAGGAAPRVLGGAQATPRGVAAAVAGASYVHVATHGWFRGSRALPDPTRRWGGLEVRGKALPGDAAAPGTACGLALALANTPAGGDDGLLTADEIALLDLGACELAVLSACDTGLGTITAGDGLLGLRRALRLAGARASLTTVWRVDDEATRRCMERFYAGLWQNGASPAAALRAAQLTMLREARAGGGQARTGTWGAFVCEAR